MTDNEIIKALFANGMPLRKVARKMDMTCQEVRSVLNTNNGAYRPYTMPASATNKLLCVMAAVYNPTSNMQEVAIIGEQATGIFYTGERICRWMSVLGFAERLRVRMAVRYQSRIHAMWVLFMAGRLEVFKRDLFRCAYCGRTPPSVVLHVDHITPVSAGGKNSQDNLITACLDCNIGKSNIPLTSVPESMADKALRMREVRDQLKAFSKLNQEIDALIEADCWTVIREIYGRNTNEISQKIMKSIRVFVEKLGVTDVMGTARIAESRVGAKGKERMFLYFCGICWRLIKERSPCPSN